MPAQITVACPLFFLPPSEYKKTISLRAVSSQGGWTTVKQWWKHKRIVLLLTDNVGPTGRRPPSVLRLDDRGLQLRRGQEIHRVEAEQDG